MDGVADRHDAQSFEAPVPLGKLFGPPIKEVTVMIDQINQVTYGTDEDSLSLFCHVKY